MESFTLAFPLRAEDNRMTPTTRYNMVNLCGLPEKEISTIITGLMKLDDGKTHSAPHAKFKMTNRKTNMHLSIMVNPLVELNEVLVTMSTGS